MSSKFQEFVSEEIGYYLTDEDIKFILPYIKLKIKEMIRVKDEATYEELEEYYETISSGSYRQPVQETRMQKYCP